MDWYSWLSKTNLDPYLVYEYGRAFTRNNLQRRDTNHFTHELLQSMGVSVAKHRLEILHLARNNTGECPKNRFQKIIMSAITKTGMLVSKKLGTCVSFKHSVHTPTLEPSPLRPQWPSVNLRKDLGFDDSLQEKVKTKMKMKMKMKMKSGPLDRRVQESYMSPKRGLSGPLDGKVQENLMVMYASPIGPLEVVDYGSRIGIPYSVVQMGCEDDAMCSIWSSMFQDIKPT